MRSRGFVAPVVSALMMSVQVASRTVTTQHKARDSLAGFPISFSHLPTNVQRDSIPPQSAAELSAEHEDPTRPLRLVRYEVDEHAGIGDRLSVMAELLSIATSFQAVLAFPSPRSSLGIVHGNTSALWWDDYVVTYPSFRNKDETHCAHGATTFNITSKTDFEELMTSDAGPLYNVAKPLCIRLQEHYFNLKLSVAFTDFALTGAPFVSVWTSNKVTMLASKIKGELMRSSLHYNAMHVRLADKYNEVCASAQHVADTAYNLTQDHPEYADEPWFLMSDGKKEFFTRMHKAMASKGLILITESDLQTTKEITDNYLQFVALECVFAASDLALNTYKEIGHRCLPEGIHSVNPKFIDCKPPVKS